MTVSPRTRSSSKAGTGVSRSEGWEDILRFPNSWPGPQPAREQGGAGVDLAGDVELALVDEAGRGDPLRRSVTRIFSFSARMRGSPRSGPPKGRSSRVMAICRSGPVCWAGTGSVKLPSVGEG